jgi:hypothetical protein
MATLKGQTTNNGGIYLQVRDRHDPDALTLFIDQVMPGSRPTTIPGFRYPEDEREAWTFDLDAMKETQPQVAGAFPPWASGKASVEPTEVGSMWRFDITPASIRNDS